VLYVADVPDYSGLLYSSLGHMILALHNLNMAAEYQPQDHSIFLYRAEIYEKVTCLCFCHIFRRICLCNE